MISISQLSIYPIKSCGGLEVNSVRLTPTGFEFDRQWMVVGGDHQYVSQREQPRLALVQPRLQDNTLFLSAPGMSLVSVDKNAAAHRVAVGLFGEQISALAIPGSADEWLSDYLGGEYRLVRQDPSFHRKGGVQYPARDAAPTSFTDNYGVLVISEASLRDLNQRLADPVPMNRFRPNIVIDGVDAYDEDHFKGARTSDAELRFIDVCYRCSMTTIDQARATSGPEPLQTLGRYRSNPSGVRFGNYAAVEDGVGNALSKGQQLEVELSF